ncbi:unnamed protein product [Protopolystoma xenopodis]|uniref:K Homology domain-containing protein n=1 Tax=Protopolystoma xenopodis TaxID=117903 RepID=A0A448X619_9PLAT|nr:unnamed protein product [Protopolystoma xenopodis]
MDTQRLIVPKVFHPFISGPNGDNIRELASRLNVKIFMPPHIIPAEDIVISGDRDCVSQAAKEIMDIYTDRVRLVSFLVCVDFVCIV